MSNRSRRQFLEDSMFAATAAAGAAWAASPASKLFAAEDRVPAAGPNDKLSICCVGVNGRGSAHVDAYLDRPDCEITYIVDADETVGKKRASEIANKQGHKPKVVQDMRRAFDDTSVDVVSIATPNHWHALASIWAMQAGKDVYVEKPVSHNVSEGRQIVEVARKYNRICQCGTQSRSSKAIREGMKYMYDGGVGEVKVARGLCYKSRPSIGPKGTYPVPAGIDYDLWVGPAPMAPVTRPKFHYDWHWQWPYGNGDLGNQGIHQMDVARRGLNVDTLCNAVMGFGGRVGYEDAGETPNTEVCFFDYGDKALVFEVRGLPTKLFMDAKVGNIFHATNGYAVITNGYDSMVMFDKEGKKQKEFHGGGDHFANFLAAVRSRKKEDLNAEILDGHLSSALCHLGNISYQLAPTEVSFSELSSTFADNPALASNELLPRLEEHLTSNKLDVNKTKFHIGPKLKFDPKTETFVGNAAADAMLTRDYRAPYVVPTADKI